MHDITLRYAQWDDCDDLLIWRNDPQTRAMFFSGEVVSQESHVSWFEKALDDPHKVILVGMLGDDQKIGVVRYDSKSKFSAFVSININPDFRGKGFAHHVLIKAEDYLPSNIDLCAEIKENNVASIKIFEGAGYILHSRKDKALFYKKNRNQS